MPQNVMTSPDGITWTLQDTPSENLWVSVVAGFRRTGVLVDNVAFHKHLSVKGNTGVFTLGSSETKLRRAIYFRDLEPGVFTLSGQAVIFRRGYILHAYTGRYKLNGFQEGTSGGGGVQPMPHTLRGLLIEQERTNVLLNSETPATQTRALISGYHNVWLEGSGSVEVRDQSDTLIGTATAAAPFEFNVATPQNYSFTVVGAVYRFQATTGRGVSTYIATQSQPVTRLAERYRLNTARKPSAIVLKSWTVLTTHLITEGYPTRKPLYFMTSATQDYTLNVYWDATDGKIKIDYNSPGVFKQDTSTAAVSGVVKVALARDGQLFSLFVNGTKIFSHVIIPNFGTDNLTEMWIGQDNQGNYLNNELQRLVIARGMLDDATCIAQTT